MKKAIPRAPYIIFFTSLKREYGMYRNLRSIRVGVFTTALSCVKARKERSEW